MAGENAGGGEKAQTGSQAEGGTGTGTADPKAGAEGAAAAGAGTVLDPKAGAETPEAKAARETKEAADAAGKVKFEGDKKSLKIPEGSPLALGLLDKIVADAKAKGLSVSETQARVDAEHGVVSAFMDSERARIKGVSDGWANDIKSHPTLGGDKFEETLALSHDAVNKFGPKGFIDILNTTGLGNHPMMVEFARNVGAAMKDDKFVHGASEGGVAEKSMGELFTGKKPEDWKK